MLWKKLTENNCMCGSSRLSTPQEWSTWKSDVRSAMCAASQLPEKGPTVVDDAPASEC